jgi:hypothetical protein
LKPCDYVKQPLAPTPGTEGASRQTLHSWQLYIGVDSGPACHASGGAAVRDAEPVSGWAILKSS